MSKRLYIVALIVTLVFSLLTVTSNAASGFKASLNPSNTSISKGSEVTITVNISDFEDNVEKGISSVTGKVTVDDAAFESLTADSFANSGDWKVSFDESTGEVTCKNLKTVKKDQDICEITVKAKSNTNSTEGSIKISDLKATDADAELTADDVSTNLTIGSTSRISNITSRNTTNTNVSRISTNTNNSSNTDDSNRNTENNTANTNTNTNSNINTNTNTNNSSRYNTIANVSNSQNTTNQSSEDKMPNTGLDDSIVKAIILVALVGLFGYIKVKSLDRE